MQLCNGIPTIPQDSKEVLSYLRMQQCQWFELAEATAYYTNKDIGNALKKVWYGIV